MESLKATIETVPERVLQVMNELLKKEEFPKPLKRSQTSTNRKIRGFWKRKERKIIVSTKHFWKTIRTSNTQKSQQNTRRKVSINQYGYRL